jgi:hypothetical protein
MTYTKTQLEKFAQEINNDWTSDYSAEVVVINESHYSLVIESQTHKNSVPTGNYMTILELEASGKIIDDGVDADAREQLDYMLNR